MASGIRRDYSRTFLDDMTLGDEELDDWVISGSEDFVKELLEIGEESLEFSAAEDELRKLQFRLNDAESRESRLKDELLTKDKKIEVLQDEVEELKRELMDERARAKDEAEDMAQEIAELRYELTEMLEEERQLRARTEQVSVHRVEELEAQVKQAKQEAVAALARRREAESQAEKEISSLRAALQEAREQLKEATSTLAAQVVEPAKEDCRVCAECVEEASSIKQELSVYISKIKEKDEQISELTRKLQQTLSEQVACTKEPIHVVKPAETAPGDHEGIASDKDDMAGKLEAFEQKIFEIQTSEIELRVERDGLYSELADLKNLVDRLNNDLAISSESHSEALLKYNAERSLMEEEAQTTKTCLSAEIHQLQQAIEERSHEVEVARKEFAVSQNNLARETDLSQELAARIKTLELDVYSEKTLHSEAASKCRDLTDTVDQTLKKLSQVEADFHASMNENGTLREVLESLENQLYQSKKENCSLQENVQELKSLVQDQEHRINRLQQDLVSQRTGNSQLAKKIGELNSELFILQQQLITCQTQVSEMAMKNVILEDTVATKKRKIKEGEETIFRQAEKLRRQEEKYFSLQAKFCALQNDFSALEAKLSESRKREQEVRIQVERLSLELNMAKQEVVNSEVRLQKAVKVAKEKLDAENSRHEELLNKHKQTEWFLNRKIEHLERSEREKQQLQQELRRIKSTGL